MPKHAEIYVIEGPDAVGKATQARLLAEYLDCKSIAFPRYDTPTGQLIEDLLHRRLTLDEHSSAPAPKSDRALREARVLQHAMTWDRYTCAELWEPERTLVLDRYWMSGWVYGSLDGLAPAELVQAHRGLPVPAHTFLIDVPPEEQLRRLNARGRAKDRYEERAAFLAQVRDRYIELLDDDRYLLDPVNGTLGKNVTIVNGLGTPEEVHARIVQAIISARSFRSVLES